MTRIALIGAGSVTFTRRLLSDLLSYPDLRELTIALHDIDEQRLATAVAMARWMAAELGSPACIEAHPQRYPALDGADYVINEVAVGGRAAARLDFHIPAKYGIRQTIADTLGIGGIFRALRTIPVTAQIGHEMARLCPHAYLLNYTNPMTMIPRSVYEGSPFPQVVGLCHSARDTEARLARLVGLPRDECAMVTAGVNHQAWVLRFEHGGKDLYPALDQVIAAEPELQRTVRVEMYRRLGYFPTESSEHGAEYVPWFLPHDDQIRQFRIPVGSYLDLLERHAGERDDYVGRLADGRGVPIEPTSELASEVVHSIQTGTPRVVYGNVRNDGLITNLPPGACVEVPCHVDRAGVRPIAIGDLPPQLAAVNRNFLNVGELVLRAALDGRREHVYHAAMLDPHTAARLTLSQIHDLVDEMIEAHAPLLPEPLRAPIRRRGAASGSGGFSTVVTPSIEAADRHPLRALPLLDWQPRPQLSVPASEVSTPAFPVIDSHTHLGRWLSPDGSWVVPDPDALVELMDSCGVHALVNLDGRWGEELAANLDRYDHAYPGRFATFCHVDWAELNRPSFGERLAGSLAASAAAGAAGLKVWKDLGLHHRDDRGELVLPDDPRLELVWEAAGELGLPVAIHTADPVAFFEPVDEHNERLEQLLNYAHWSYADPRFPRFQRLINALEAVVAAHPRTTFIGVHVGCYSENLGWVNRMLDTYPNFSIDIAARIAELGRQPRATRALMLRHPDRVLFGTDQIPPDAAGYPLHYRFLQTADEHFPHDPSGSPLMGRWMISGVDLPSEVLQKVYAGNAARLIPSLRPALVRPSEVTS